MLKSPRSKTACIVLVFLSFPIGLAGFRQIQKYDNSKKFEQVAVDETLLANKLIADGYSPELTKYCMKNREVFGDGPTSCSVETKLEMQKDDVPKAEASFTEIMKLLRKQFKPQDPVVKMSFAPTTHTYGYEHFASGVQCTLNESIDGSVEENYTMFIAFSCFKYMPWPIFPLIPN